MHVEDAHIFALSPCQPPIAKLQISRFTGRVRAVAGIASLRARNGNSFLPVRVSETCTTLKELITWGKAAGTTLKSILYPAPAPASKPGCPALQPDGSNFGSNIAQQPVRASEKSQYNVLSGRGSTIYRQPKPVTGYDFTNILAIVGKVAD
jgi:hypothetical protein